MANINFDDYQKNQDPEVETIRKKITVGSLDVKDTQYYVKEEDILFDFMEIDFGGDQGIGVEVWLSYLGGDFKMKVDMMSKEDFDTLNIGEYIGKCLTDNYECLNCKNEILDSICSQHEEDQDEKA